MVHPATTYIVTTHSTIHHCMDAALHGSEQCAWKNQLHRHRTTYYAPGLKGLPGHLVIGSSVRQLVCNSIPPTSAILKVWWLYSNQTWTASSSKVAHTFPLGRTGVKIHILTLSTLGGILSKSRLVFVSSAKHSCSEGSLASTHAFFRMVPLFAKFLTHGFYKAKSYAWLPDRRTDRQTPDKVIPMCRYASQAPKKGN